MSEDGHLTKQLYVYCGVCLTKDPAFYLTSCAHIICQRHRDKIIQTASDTIKETQASSINGSHPPSHRHTNDVNSHTQPNNNHSLQCPVCSTKDISIVPLTKKSLPSELEPYFQSFLPGLENIYSIAKFQYDGLAEYTKSQMKMVERLTAKIHQYRDTIKMARLEILKADEYKA